MPLFVIGGIIGEIISAIPYVVVAILIASLIECFLILPTHMHGALSKKRKSTGGFRNWFDRGFKAFRDRYLPMSFEELDGAFKSTDGGRLGPQPASIQ